MLLVRSVSATQDRRVPGEAAESVFAPLRDWANRCRPSDCRSPASAALEAGSDVDEQAFRLALRLAGSRCLGRVLPYRLDHELRPRRHDRPSAYSGAGVPAAIDASGVIW